MCGMAFSEHERAANHAALKWFLARRTPPEHIRAQLDFGYAIVGHTVDLQEILTCPVCSGHHHVDFGFA